MFCPPLPLFITCIDQFQTCNTQQGFWYHHAEPTYLMLAYWIPTTAHTLPANASHTVGIGAFIMNNKREVNSVPIYVYNTMSPVPIIFKRHFLQPFVVFSDY